ncbi:uncharacterized protein, partial [Populus alba]|uniref:uncharacterized protein n=1 Tax=Populus alba TaxID=43335 RepID=UPI003CC78E2B
FGSLSTCISSSSCGRKLILCKLYFSCNLVSIFQLGGGYLFGLPVGFVADSIGAAGAAFLLGRTIGRSFVVSKLKDYPKFSSVAIAIQKSGFKPITLALVYIGTTLKDLSDVTHGWSEFSTTRWVLIVLGLVVSGKLQRS